MRRRTTYPLLFLSALLSSASSRLATDGYSPQPPQPKRQPFSDTVPQYETTAELLRLSHDIYAYRHLTSCDEIRAGNVTRPLPKGSRCHLYEHNLVQDTQVMVVSRPGADRTGGRIGRYVAVVFAGTDDFRNVLTDGNIFLSPLGPIVNGTYPLVPSAHPDVRVHSGFNNAVFNDGLFDRVAAAVDGVLDRHPSYRLLTAGHSLGGADSIIAAAALAERYGDGGHSSPSRPVLSVSFGCPRAGNRAFQSYVNSIPNLAIWRFVNSIDIVPRLPDALFFHVGHTVQMDGGGSKAYYRHEGNWTRGLRGVPFGWEVAPFVPIVVPYSGICHMIRRYLDYLIRLAEEDREVYYVDHFAVVGEDDDDATPADDDFPDHLGDDDFPQNLATTGHNPALQGPSAEERAVATRDALDLYAGESGAGQVLSSVESALI